jgi:hypothetical protein
MTDLITVDGIEETKLRKLLKVFPSLRTCNVSDPRIRYLRSYRTGSRLLMAKNVKKFTAKKNL